MPPSSRTSGRSRPRTDSASLPSSERALSTELAQLDETLQRAGLVRSHRKRRGNVARPARFQGKTPEELRPAPAVTTVAENGAEFVRVAAWNAIRWLWHGFSGRRGGLSTVYAPEGAPGELNLGFTPEDDHENVSRNRQLLAEAITGNPATPLVTVRQIHSSVLVVSGGTGPVCKGDGLMTNERGVLLGIQTADCIPVLVADRKRKVVAAFHAGWRGTVKRIVECGIGRMRFEFGCRPQDMIAAIGPGIGPCCYAVGEEVVSEFESQFAYGRDLFHEVPDSDPVRIKYPMLFMSQRAPGHSPIGPAIHLDLVEANRRQLVDAGLGVEAIQIVGGCTSCQHHLFFSHRASRGRSGRMLSVIGIRP